MSNSAKRKGLVVALVGESGAGKTTSTGILESRGFVPVALSTHLRDLAIAEFGIPTRSQVQNLARETQIREGDDYFARAALSNGRFDAAENVVVDGLRNLAELAHFTKATQRSGRAFLLLAILAADETRFARVVKRGRAGDPLVRSKFDADDARARGDEKTGFQQNGILIGMAGRKIKNSGDLVELTNALERAVKLDRNGETGSGAQ